jgi:transcriptional regulator with XRE-family HTH domain
MVKEMSKLSVTEVDKLVGERIQQRRKELQLTAAVLSEKVGLSQQQLSRYERGTNKINLSHLVNIASCLSSPIGWFFVECKPDIPNLVADESKAYAPVTDQDLKARLEQHWDLLTSDQRRGLIVLLDSFKNNP